MSISEGGFADTWSGTDGTTRTDEGEVVDRLTADR
jgi:hypothetical protein